jgi:hypothetical protein
VVKRWFSTFNAFEPCNLTDEIEEHVVRFVGDIFFIAFYSSIEEVMMYENKASKSSKAS